MATRRCAALLLACVVLAAVALAGCAGAAWPAARGYDDPLIVYQRSGGALLTRLVWRFHADGRVERSDEAGDTVRAMDGAQIAAAASRIAAAGFFDLSDVYMAGQHCCGRFEHRITLNYSGKSKTVVTYDGAGHPDALEGILNEINTLIGRLEAQPGR